MIRKLTTFVILAFFQFGGKAGIGGKSGVGGGPTAGGCTTPSPATYAWQTRNFGTQCGSSPTTCITLGQVIYSLADPVGGNTATNNNVSNGHPTWSPAVAGTQPAALYSSSSFYGMGLATPIPAATTQYTVLLLGIDPTASSETGDLVSSTLDNNVSFFVDGGKLSAYVSGSGGLVQATNPLSVNTMQSAAITASCVSGSCTVSYYVLSGGTATANGSGTQTWTVTNAINELGSGPDGNFGGYVSEIDVYLGIHNSIQLTADAVAAQGCYGT